MRSGRLRHWLRYGIGCSDAEWDTRQALMATLPGNGYLMKEAPNPLRLTATKEGEEFIIDILGKDKVHILPVKWVDGHTDEPILVTDIPNSGRCGIWNKQSKYYDELSQLAGAK